MAGIGVGLLWFAYWWGLSGFSLVKGYNNSPLQLANPVKVATFTTQCYTGTGIFPTGDPADSGSCGPGKNMTGGPLVRGKPLPTTVPIPRSGKCPPGYDRQSDGTCRLHSQLPL